MSDPTGTTPPESLSVSDVIAMLAYAYDESHREGIGCGHDLSPGCQHDGAAWVEEEIAYGIASPVRDHLARLMPSRLSR